jgi:hypothetical protein
MACRPDQVRVDRRAIALNPKDPQNLGGTLMAASGFREEGVSIPAKGIFLTAARWWWVFAKRRWFRSEPAALWPGVTVTEDSLTQCISELISPPSHLSVDSWDLLPIG